MRRTKPVVIANAAGWGNFGDDLLAVATADLFRKDPRARQVSLLSGPHPPSAVAGNSKILDWRHRVRVGHLLVDAGAVVIAGGGVLNDRPLHFYRPYLRASKLCAATGGRIVVSGVGVFSEKPSRRFVECLHYLAARAAHFTVRDRASADLVARMTGRTPRIVPDLAFGLCVPPHGEGRGRDIGVCVRPWWHTLASADANERTERMLRALARHLLQARKAAAPGAKILLIPFHIATADDDRPILARLQALLGDGAELCEPKSADDAIRAVRRCQVLIGMRLHSLIVAALVGVPPVAIAYDPKVDAMMGTLGRREFAIPLERVDDIDISDLLMRTLESRSGDLSARVASLRSEAADERSAVLAATLDR